MKYLYTFYLDYIWLAPLLATVFFTYLWARMIHLLPYPNARKLVLICGVSQNLALFFFAPTFGVAIYTLESISCLVDVYRKKAVPSHNILPLFYYLGFFPRYFAGPIIQYKDFVKQLEKPFKKKPMRGTLLILYALVLKLCFADSFEEYVRLAFNQTPAPTFLCAWIGVVANYFQLYFNFSAFSLAAIGIGMWLGFDFPENFKSPLLATSVTSFWDRWNITLGEWVKTYFYAPLAFKFKHSKLISTFLLFSLLLIIGIWYGTEPRFFAMGVWFGLWVVFEQVDRYHEKIPPVLKGVFTFFIISTGFLFLRVDSLEEGIRVLHSLYAKFDLAMPTVEISSYNQLHLALCICGILFVWTLEPWLRRFFFAFSTDR